MPNPEKDSPPVSMMDGLSYLNQGLYRDLDWDATLDYMLRRYVRPLQDHLRIEDMTLADCAAGFGWFAFAYLRAGGKHATLIEPDHLRLQAAEQIANQLGLAKRCTFVNSTLQDTHFRDLEFDIFASIETLEHVGRENFASCILTITRCARHCVLLTSPNAAFPMIAHDTRLPFAHWLPKKARKTYARIFGRINAEAGNDFLWAKDLKPLRQQFSPNATYQTFRNYREFLDFYPHYVPYGPPQDRSRHKPSLALSLFVYAVGKLCGTNSYIISPNLANIWIRNSTLTKNSKQDKRRG